MCFLYFTTGHLHFGRFDCRYKEASLRHRRLYPINITAPREEKIQQSFRDLGKRIVRLCSKGIVYEELGNE